MLLLLLLLAFVVYMFVVVIDAEPDVGGGVGDYDGMFVRGFFPRGFGGGGLASISLGIGEAAVQKLWCLC